jgi:hypothetical protein
MYTLQGKTRPTWHVRFPRHFTYTRRTLPAGSPRTWQPFIQSSPDLNRSTAPEKKGSRHNLQHAVHPIRGSVPSFSPTTANGAVGKSQAFVDSRLLDLPDPYHRHAIGTFNTCSRGPTEWSLIDIDGGYNLGGADLPRTHSLTFPTRCPHFSLMALPGLQFNQVPAINPKCWVKDPMAATWSFNHSAIYHSLHLCIAIANDLSLLVGSQG